MRVVVVLAVVVGSVGCDFKHEQKNLQPLIAVTGNYGVWSAVVGPTPAPAPSKVCGSCNGRGKVGDGRVAVTCAACDGTGVAKEEKPCTTGTCQMRSIAR
jgi:hypothetical protein